MKDNFSRQAGLYAKYRPGYPPELFDFLYSKLQEKNRAWDCATGNGQTAIELAKVFHEVYATDISPKQLEHAHQAPNIHYSCQPAEKTSFEDSSFDLVTVSQALHWFATGEFYSEVKRTGKPGAWIAAWMYGGLNITPEIDRLKKHHYAATLGAYWDTERKHVDENYRTLYFPFAEIECPVFEIRNEWTMEELEGYLNTWSALQKFMAENNYNPVPELMKKIQPYWTGNTMPVVFPVHMRMGRIVR